MTDVQLYIYDLSKGMAKEISLGLLGKQIEAIYHTSIVMETLEYVYDGGIHAVPAGKTHLGPPIKTELLGKTELPKDVIWNFLESLKEKYSEKTYDIWTNNCNHFSNEFATFLVGRGIPSYISNLPQDVLTTPFGLMIKSHIDRIARQAQANRGGLLGIKNLSPSLEFTQNVSYVKEATSMFELDHFLQEAKRSCAILFFTSRTCPPCNALYPTFQEMAAKVGRKETFILVDIVACPDIGMKYSITGTPTLMTFLRGKNKNRWTGSDPAMLKRNVELLLQMVPPLHPHDSLLPTFHAADAQPALFTNLPPLENLKKKLGLFAEDSSLKEVLNFVSAQANDGNTEAPLPNLKLFSQFLRDAPSKLSLEIIFIAVDLFRICMAHPRVCKYFAEEKHHQTVASLILHVNSLAECPYPLRLVTLQLACNLFTNQLYCSEILRCPSLTEPIMQLTTSSLLDEKHISARVAAASLAFNIASTNGKFRVERQLDLLPETEQVALAASLLEAISVEKESPESLKGLLLALSHLFFRATEKGDLRDLLKSMDAHETVLLKQKSFPNELLVEEVGKILLGKGLE